MTKLRTRDTFKFYVRHENFNIQHEINMYLGVLSCGPATHTHTYNCPRPSSHELVDRTHKPRPCTNSGTAC